jgi:hypothetical protein
MSYRSESKFSEALCDKLTAEGVFHQRIETALTGRGVPDLVVPTRVGDVWVELKNQPRVVLDVMEVDAELEVAWRAGQQAWAFNYRRATGRCVATVVACMDDFFVVPMQRRYIRNLVPMHDGVVLSSLSDVIAVLFKKSNNF